jgi:hypothetical protein
VQPGVLLALALVVFPPAVPAQHLAVSLNQSSLTVGNTLTVTAFSQGGSAISGDLYVVILLPDGSLFASDGASPLLVFDGVRVVPEALQPFARNALLAGERPLLPRPEPRRRPTRRTRVQDRL